MPKLKKCPCGQTPKELGISPSNTSKWAFTYGTCCSEWNVEFRTRYYDADSLECMDLAIEEWNKAPRELSL